MAIITLKNFKVPMFIGIYPHEKETQQTVLITLEMTVDISKSSQSDKIQDALDYDHVIDCVTVTLQSKHFNLIEHAPDVVLTHLLATFPQILGCHIELKKPSAIQNADYISVSIEKKS